MVIVRMMGGLGNQMFQYAMGYSLSLQLNDYLGIDTGWYKQFNYPHLQLEINKFPIEFLRGNSPQSDTILLEGYFQNPSYFNHNKDEFKRMFVAEHDIIDDDVCAVHIRRNDYVALHRTLQRDYYERAMDIMGNKFLVFTDDVRWVKNEFNLSVHESINPIYDLLTMSTAKKFIIANSSYSWWAAYLSGSKNVVYPSSILETNNIDICKGLGWKIINTVMI